MRLLLDTHTLLWWLSDDQQLGSRARELIADPANDVLISVVSLWDVVVKLRVGKLRADIGEITAAARAQGFALLGITPAHLSVLAELPMHHRDPFGHLLIAQAMVEQALFVSSDQAAPLFGIAFVACSDSA